MFRFRAALCVLSAVISAPCQHAWAQQGASVKGVVVDSLEKRPLVGAVVQLVAHSTQTLSAVSARADSSGRFAFDSVAPGQYTIGFFHPRLDSLGLAAPVQQVIVKSGARMVVHLGIPGPPSVRAAICGRRTAHDSGAVILGVVRRAESRESLDSAGIVAQWSELTLASSGWTRRIEQRRTTSNASGWYALCDLPRGGSIALYAFRAGDSTAMLDLEVVSAAVRRDLYVGAASNARVATTPPRVARLQGVVLRGATGDPLPDAQVRVGGGPATKSDSAGGWVLTEVAMGTRMLDVRAVGYYPLRAIVDVVDEAAPLRITMSRFAAVLDTVRIIAARLADPRRSGFVERRRSAVGRYVTAVDIARRQPRSVSEVLRGVPGIKLERFGTYVDTTAIDTSGTGTNPIGFNSDATRILMRATVKDWCFPTFYIDGHQVNSLSAEEVDGWVRPDEISGIEVYGAETVPPQFAMPLANCGSILIWRK